MIERNNLEKSLYLGIPCWLWGLILAAAAKGLMDYPMGIGSNYTTMWYLNQGCTYDDQGNVTEWNPPPPLDDSILPTVERAQKIDKWLKGKSPCEFEFFRDFILCGSIVYLGTLTPMCLGRIDIVWYSVLLNGILSLGKFPICLTFQTPHSAGKDLAIQELGGEKAVMEWRDPKKYWKNLFWPGFSHVADMIYSGHTFHLLIWIYASIWAIYQSKCKYRKCCLISISIWYALAGLSFFAILLATRMHYSFDVYLAAALWLTLSRIPEIWELAQKIAGRFASRNKDGEFITGSIEHILCMKPRESEPRIPLHEPKRAIPLEEPEKEL